MMPRRALHDYCRTAGTSLRSSSQHCGSTTSARSSRLCARTKVSQQGHKDESCSNEVVRPSRGARGSGQDVERIVHLPEQIHARLVDERPEPRHVDADQCAAARLKGEIRSQQFSFANASTAASECAALRELWESSMAH